MPLAARQLLNLPARPHFEGATPGAVSLGNVTRRADDLTATGVVRAGNDGGQFFVTELRRLDQRHAGVGHLVQVVAGNLGGQPHGNAAGAVEQGKRQARGQLAWLLGGAVVVGHKVHGAFVNFVQQQAGDLGQTRLGVAHGRSAVAVARAEVALAVNQRVAQGKVLRHAHRRVVHRRIPVRVKPAQHIAHHARALDGLGAHIAIGPAKAQAHARHGIQNAPLHRLLAIAHIGQGAPLDHAQGVLQVSALGVGGQVELVVALRRGAHR